MANAEPDEIDLALQREKSETSASGANFAGILLNNGASRETCEDKTGETSKTESARTTSVTVKPETQSVNSSRPELCFEETGSEEDSSDSCDSDSSDSDSDSSDSDLGDSSDENVENENNESDNDTEVPRTRNELLEDTIPKFPSDLTIDKSTSVEAVGHIKAVGNRSVVISANNSARYRVLADGTALVIDNDRNNRVPLGVLYETFGPVDKPFYVVKFESEEEIEPFKSRIGEPVSQVVSTARYILTEEFKTKGTDASNFNDEEVPLEEQEFSDDEQEMLAKGLKTKKRKKAKKPGEAVQTRNPPLQSNSQAPGNKPVQITPELMQQWYQFQQFQQYQYQMCQQQAPPPPPPY